MRGTGHHMGNVHSMDPHSWSSLPDIFLNPQIRTAKENQRNRQCHVLSSNECRENGAESEESYTCSDNQQTMCDYLAERVPFVDAPGRQKYGETCWCSFPRSQIGRAHV